MAYEKKEDDMGALWIKSSARGEFMTGTIGGVAVVCFRNDGKTGKQPDWRVLKSKPREEALPHERAAWSTGQPITSDDVPF